MIRALRRLAAKASLVRSSRFAPVRKNRETPVVSFANSGISSGARPPSGTTLRMIGISSNLATRASTEEAKASGGVVFEKQSPLEDRQKVFARHLCSIQLGRASFLSNVYRHTLCPGVSHVARYLASCGIEFSSPIKPIYESGRTRMIEGELPSLSV
jgi:hypothetical protein